MILGIIEMILGGIGVVLFTSIFYITTINPIKTNVHKTRNKNTKRKSKKTEPKIMSSISNDETDILSDNNDETTIL